MDTPDQRVVELCELGSLGFRHDGGWASMRGERTAVLLAALSLHRRHGVSTERLIETIWPSPDQPPSARQSLSNIVSRLRRTFGDDVIESTRSGYRLGANVSSDRDRFVADIGTAVDLADTDPSDALAVLDRALPRWRGEPWIGLERPAEVEADRARLIELRTVGLRTQGAAMAAAGRVGDAVPVLRNALSLNPVDEDTAQRLARALADLGRRPEALRVIRDTRRSLADSGLVENPTLTELEQTLLGIHEASSGAVAPGTADTSVTAWARPPSPRTSFIGRAREIAEVVAALDEARLVTILGTGGAGKTRLAIQVASSVTHDERRPMGFVDLISARSESDVELALGAGLGVPRDEFEPLATDDRRRALASSAGPGLLVVDNCEHVVDHVRELVHWLLDETDGLTVLATSRTPLELSGERRYPIPRFDLAADLFRDRMIARGVPIDATDSSIAAICELVDDLPLAVELAAAQGPYRTLDEIVVELGRGAVHHDPTMRDDRHETMAAAIRWSHRLLAPDAREALTRLGFFVAPFDRSDAAAVLGGATADEVVDTLVRCSLLERSTDGERSTYRMLVPIRQYAAGELDRAGTTRAIALRYSDWLLELTDRPHEGVWSRFDVMDELAPRLANSSAAIEALRNAGRIDDAARLAGRLAGAGYLYGRTTELIEFLESLWPVTEDVEARADALVGVLMCADGRGEFGRLRRALDQLDALQMPRPTTHRIVALQVRANWTMWAEMLSESTFDESSDLLARAREVATELGSSLELGIIEHSQSCLHLFEGDWTSAADAAARCRAAAEGTLEELVATTCLAFARLHLGDPDGALAVVADHPERDRYTVVGDVIRIVSALAEIERGDTGLGLSELDSIRRRAQSTPFPLHVDSVAVAIAHAAHALGDDDIALDLLTTGLRGKGAYIGHLVPNLCREIGIPLTARYVPYDERIGRSRRIAGLAESSLGELLRRHE